MPAVTLVAMTAVTAPGPDRAYVPRIDGRACPYCGCGIEKPFEQHEAVAATEIDVERGLVIVTTEPGTGLSSAELHGVVHDAGFATGEIVHRPPAE